MNTSSSAGASRDSTVFVVEVRYERAGAIALVRAADSTAVSTFTTAETLWDFLLRVGPERRIDS